jgi:hypothetical protein
VKLAWRKEPWPREEPDGSASEENIVGVDYAPSHCSLDLPDRKYPGSYHLKSHGRFYCLYVSDRAPYEAYPIVRHFTVHYSHLGQITVFPRCILPDTGWQVAAEYFNLSLAAHARAVLAVDSGHDFRVAAPSRVKIERVSLDQARFGGWSVSVARAALVVAASTLVGASFGCSISLGGSEGSPATAAPDANAPSDASAPDATLDAQATDAAGTEAAATDATLDDGPGSAPDAAPIDAPIPRDTSGPCANTAASCGATGACVSCATSLLGQTCLLLNGAETCGCGGPALPTDCPVGMACRTMQCETACDGQHPCNGGCCSAVTNGTCVASCPNNATCVLNACP